VPKKNPEAGALGAPVRRLILTGRRGVGGRDRPVGPVAAKLVSPSFNKIDPRHKTAGLGGRRRPAIERLSATGLVLDR
jgi:hypothetical protein